jgi:hypothetical protein
MFIFSLMTGVMPPIGPGFRNGLPLPLCLCCCGIIARPLAGKRAGEVVLGAKEILGVGRRAEGGVRSGVGRGAKVTETRREGLAVVEVLLPPVLEGWRTGKVELLGVAGGVPRRLTASGIGQELSFASIAAGLNLGESSPERFWSRAIIDAGGGVKSGWASWLLPKDMTETGRNARSGL